MNDGLKKLSESLTFGSDFSIVFINDTGNIGIFWGGALYELGDLNSHEINTVNDGPLLFVDAHSRMLRQRIVFRIDPKRYLEISSPREDDISGKMYYPEEDAVKTVYEGASYEQVANFDSKEILIDSFDVSFIKDVDKLRE